MLGGGMIPPASMPKKLATTESLSSEMKRFTQIRETDPDTARVIFDTGEKLVSYAEQGQLSKFRALVFSTDQSHILMYFTSKAFMRSLICNHLMLSSYMIDVGYPLNSDSIPNPLQKILQKVSSVDDDVCCAMARFLVQKGLDVNKQETDTWFTVLHTAVSRGLIETCKYLVSVGADVNAVAKDDVMPLGLAYANIASSPNGQVIVELLMDKGARTSWRRANGDQSATSWGHVESTSVAVKPSYTSGVVGADCFKPIVTVERASSSSNSVSIAVDDGSGNGSSRTLASVIDATPSTTPAAAAAALATSVSSGQRKMVSFSGGGGGAAFPAPMMIPGPGREDAAATGKKTMVSFRGGGGVTQVIPLPTVDANTVAEITSEMANTGIVGTSSSVAVNSMSSSGATIDGYAGVDVKGGPGIDNSSNNYSSNISIMEASSTQSVVGLSDDGGMMFSTGN